MGEGALSYKTNGPPPTLKLLPPPMVANHIVCLEGFPVPCEGTECNSDDPFKASFLPAHLLCVSRRNFDMHNLH